MKSFLNFLLEAKNSKVSNDAARMGLRSDGHGGWYNERGEFTAKTSGNGLEFFNSNQIDNEKDPKQSELDKKISGQEPAGGADLETTVKDTEGDTVAQEKKRTNSKTNSKDAVAPSIETPTEQQYPADVPKTKGTITIAFGRFNPPTAGHLKLMDKVASCCDDNDYIIIPSRAEDKKKNPLGVDEKVSMMRKIFPDHAEKIVNDSSNCNIFDVLRKAHNDGYANIRIVGGGDKIKQYEKLANQYNGSTYQFDNIDIVNAGMRDDDSDDISGSSSSKMRKAAADNDFRLFKKGMPNGLTTDIIMSIFTDLQGAMGITPKETVSMEGWEIAPKLYLRDLREEYRNETIFNIGDIITHDPTGMDAKIVRKGANHLICVTEDNKMFKTWTQDVSYNTRHDKIDNKINTFKNFLTNFT